ncbi:protein-L-isoaspartate(D-aspartate) O-methyltransferase [Salinicoccus halitifaciens]|uniref:Protein-L-isoaspartate O-methyltransferase n=1 Tax=Salinicoccus halitifaciens TaxID=1073415 RepID=A0ABV2ECY6_9STAP|nr:protein-L-isoaspartate(D-aspartate) O-methyltransferase [Salinicoccus halitifaciens]MCD2138085.1 protein-L-isoaspartate(D-aspartate) O-methyltransferase [Salinicoccus halitifaciens]
MRYTDEEIRKYFMQLDRSRFIDEQKELAVLDRPLPIGHGQTISQPSLVLTMTLKLELDSEDKVLEIGTGSGFQTALLSKFSRSVYTVERIKTLHERARERLTDLGYRNIHFHYGDGHEGWEEHAPYDKIMVTAAAEEMPENLINQLAPGGRMIIPVGSFFGQELKLIEKDKKGRVSESTIEHVMFVKFKKNVE